LAFLFSTSQNAIIRQSKLQWNTRVVESSYESQRKTRKRLEIQELSTRYRTNFLSYHAHAAFTQKYGWTSVVHWENKCT